MIEAAHFRTASIHFYPLVQKVKGINILPAVYDRVDAGLICSYFVQDLISAIKQMLQQHHLGFRRHPAPQSRLRGLVWPPARRHRNLPPVSRPGKGSPVFLGRSASAAAESLSSYSLQGHLRPAQLPIFQRDPPGHGRKKRSP